MSDGHIRELMREFQEGRLPRRQFIAKLLAAGLTMPAVAGVIAACGGGGTTSTPSTSGGGAGAPATQAPAAGASPAAGAAQASGFTPTKRGGGGTLKLLWWQAVSVLNNHLSTGTKDQDGSRLFLEPLASIDQDGNIVPILAAEAPSVAKNTLDKDGKFVIWKLKPNVTWHDGQKFTADDVVFTFQYASDPDTAATSSGAYTNVASVEKVDDLTVKVNFKSPTLEWTAPFVSNNGLILPKHVHEKFKGKESRNAPANLKPVGTGPYKIVEFRPNDIVIAEINDKYHVENRPFFDRVEMKGGGDAVSAARATLQTGEYDYAWNLQVPGDQLDRLE
ncbi:MAG: ABC transporter substrate-binding protein, partial [Dehalococcoidia bacterium]